LRIEDCTAVILCGGDSRRMGQDKARIPLHGRTLLEHVLHSIRPLFSEVLLAVRRPRHGVDISQVCDVTDCVGPMAGVAATLAQARAPWVFVLGCDMPFVSSDLIRRLAEKRGGQDAVVPVWQGMPQPLAGFYGREVLPRIRRRIQEGSFSMMHLLKALDVEYVPENEWSGMCPYALKDLDTPEDIQWARNIMIARERNANGL